MAVGTHEVSIENLVEYLDELKGELTLDSQLLASKVRLGLTNGASVAQLLTLAAETAGSLVTRHPNWSYLAARLLLACTALKTPPKFSEYVRAERRSLSEDFVAFVLQHEQEIDQLIDFSADLQLTYFAVRTLEQSYLHPNERIQYMWMRVALSLNMSDLQAGFETYRLLSGRYYTHATPTLFNAGYRNGQLASCFVVAMKGNSIEKIFDTLKDCAIITHKVGGIGLHCSNITAANRGFGECEDSSTTGRGTSGRATNGIVPMLRVFNNASRFVDQGENKRPGAISITLEPWHADIFSFLDLRKNHGKEEWRARDLFYALWIPDLFMEKVKDNEDWFLFSPDIAPGLQDVCGESFKQLYERYVSEKRFSQVIPARKLWASILDSQIETGNPSLLYKDSCNQKSNQRNLGTIKSSNLCTEIIEYSSEDETAVCNLASVGLPRFVKSETEFDFAQLHRVVKVAISNLNHTIDTNSYPLENCERGNLKHRPLALGVQGLADVYFRMRYSFDSTEANMLNRRIFETIYHGALEASVDLAEKSGRPYASFEGSPLQQGLLQFDLWDVHVKDELWDWTRLRERIKASGVYNSLLTAVMPTASTSQILGFTESIEPLTSNMYSRRTLSGEFQVVNPYMVEDLDRLGLWTDDIREEIIARNGSVQNIEQIPADVRHRYRTAWELSMKAVIDQSVARAPFIDQSQSLNLFVAQPTHRQLSSMHFNAWSRGLKTGMYYLRTQPAATPIPFTVSHETRKRVSPSTATREPVTSSKRTCSPIDPVCEACT